MKPRSSFLWAGRALYSLVHGIAASISTSNFLFEREKMFFYSFLTNDHDTWCERKVRQSAREKRRRQGSQHQYQPAGGSRVAAFHQWQAHRAMERRSPDERQKHNLAGHTIDPKSVLHDGALCFDRHAAGQRALFVRTKRSRPWPSQVDRAFMWSPSFGDVMYAYIIWIPTQFNQMLSALGPTSNRCSLLGHNFCVLVHTSTGWHGSRLTVCLERCKQQRAHKEQDENRPQDPNPPSCKKVWNSFKSRRLAQDGINKVDASHSSSIIKFGLLVCPFLFFSLLKGFPNLGPNFERHIVRSSCRWNFCESLPRPHIPLHVFLSILCTAWKPFQESDKLVFDVPIIVNTDQYEYTK